MESSKICLIYPIISNNDLSKKGNVAYTLGVKLNKLNFLAFYRCFIITVKTNFLSRSIEILYTFPTYQCLQKGFGIFFILIRAWVICQNQKRPGFYTLTETRFINNSRSKQNLKNPEHHLVILVKGERVQNFSKKY